MRGRHRGTRQLSLSSSPLLSLGAEPEGTSSPRVSTSLLARREELEEATLPCFTEMLWKLDVSPRGR